MILLDVQALLGPSGVILGRSPGLHLPSGVMLQPSEDDVTAFDSNLRTKKVLSRNHVRFIAAVQSPSTFSGDPPLDNLQKTQVDVWVEDLASTNGTWVNGEKLQPHVLTKVMPGARVQLGLPAFKMDYTIESSE